MFSHDFIFMSIICALLILSVNDHVIYMFFMKYIFFIPYLKDFVLVFKFFLKLVRILHYGRVFQTYYIFKLIFENPYPFKGG